MTHWLHPDAEAELGEAAMYYATHASLAIAEAFLAEFERVRDLLIENQHRGPRGDDGLRVFHFDRFPYTVIYEPDNQAGPQIYLIGDEAQQRPKTIVKPEVGPRHWQTSPGETPRSVIRS